MSYRAAVAQAASLPDDAVLMRGGSAIIDPLGKVLAGPDYSAESILYADIDLGALAAAKFDFDVVGHYARPDVFQLRVDVGNNRAVSAIGAEKSIC